MDFTGKTALVTGAASGMGRLFAQNWTNLGGNAVLCDVNEAALQEQAAALGEKALPVACDVRDYAQVCHARDAAVERFGAIDVLVNFAGGSATRMCGVDKAQCPEFPDVPIEVFDWGIDVNLKGQFYFDHAVMKQMRAQESGLIVNIGSCTGVDGDAYSMDYPTAKSGVMHGLTVSLAQYGAKYGVRCVCVSPGPVSTRPEMEKLKTLLGRPAEPQEIVDMILFIASDKGQFIDGANIMVDGGRSIARRFPK